MKHWVVTYEYTAEHTEHIYAMDERTALHLAEMIGTQKGLKVKRLYEGVDMNKFLCKEPTE